MLRVRYSSIRWALIGALTLIPIYAQERFDVNAGVGTAYSKAGNFGIDSSSFTTCDPATGGSTCMAAPKLDGVFIGAGGSAMFNKRFGFGMDFLTQPARADYGPFKSRQTFYTFDGIYEPVSTKHYAIQLRGGLGGARTGFSYDSNSCVGGVVCSSGSSSVGSSNHFATHVGIGLQVYLTEHIFVRPQFDWRYVPNLTQQFGSNSVPAATIWVGYSMGHSK